MLTRVHRPKTFAELRGSESVKHTLQAVARKPQNAPTAYILYGPFGTGKTSAARIFARAVNCEKHTGDACNKCLTCRSIVDGSPLYIELDSAVAGNVDIMRSTRESFAYSIQDGHKVIVFDETQLISKQAQAALLTILEEAPARVFFVFCTTNAEAILETITSRCLTLQFDSLSDEDIIDLVTDIATKESIPLNDLAKQQIVRRVHGHARDAVQQLERIRLDGLDFYTAQSIFLEDKFKEYLRCLEKEKTDDAQALLHTILKHPLLHVQQDWDIFMSKLAQICYFKQGLPRYRSLFLYYINNSHSIRSTNDWYIFLSSLGPLIREKKPSEAPTSRFERN